MRRVARLLLVPLALVATVAACGGDDDSGSASAEPGVVTVKDNKFDPKAMTVSVGDTVTWKFTGASAHNVTFDDFNSTLMKTGTFKHTFDKAGTYTYTCTIHSGMKGTIEVTAGKASSAP